MLLSAGSSPLQLRIARCGLDGRRKAPAPMLAEPGLARRHIKGHLKQHMLTMAGMACWLFEGNACELIRRTMNPRPSREAWAMSAVLLSSRDERTGVVAE